MLQMMREQPSPAESVLVNGISFVMQIFEISESIEQLFEGNITLQPITTPDTLLKFNTRGTSSETSNSLHAQSLLLLFTTRQFYCLQFCICPSFDIFLDPRSWVLTRHFFGLVQTGHKRSVLDCACLIARSGSRVLTLISSSFNSVICHKHGVLDRACPTSKVDMNNHQPSHNSHPFFRQSARSELQH